MKWPVKLLVSCCVAGVALALSVGFSRSLKAGSDGLSPMMDTIPHWYFFDLAENEHFKAAGLCDGCHGHDLTGFASVDAEGNDISPITTWRATMMANAGRDPFFRAKVSHEALMNPQHQSALEDKCTTCHAPLGRFNAHYEGNEYSLAELENDPFGQDGVSCMGCHKQTPERSGINHSGELYYADTMIEYGPFDKPYQAPMQDFVGLTPEYGEHVTKGGFCAGCHTLLTNSVDLQGNYTGTTFVEQATYHEWLNSIYSLQNGTTCQGCHMPRVYDGVVVAANYLTLSPRSPYGKHDLAGANAFMLKLMKANRDELGIRAGDEHFDATIAKTLFNLQQRSLIAELGYEGITADTAYFGLKLRNLVGHKFPSGYPTRRVFVEFVVKDELGDTVFSSGLLDANHDLIGENSTYEPHYDVIYNPDQVQIYEMVMGNVNGEVTNVLERANQPLKDNRLVPAGFTTSHQVYDTTAIAGNANFDDDFNFDGLEGTGTDKVHFHVALNGDEGTINASARIYYQSIPKRAVQDMFAASTPQIDTFEVMFNNADHTPVLVASDTISGIPVPLLVQDNELERISIYPVPSSGMVWLSGLRNYDGVEIDIYNMEGRKVLSYSLPEHQGIALPDASGVYFLAVRKNNEVRVLRTVRK